MSQLYISDIFKIYYNYESSRIKLWEIVRTYDPIEFAKLLYLLENVTKQIKRKTIDLTLEQMQDFCNYHIREQDYQINVNLGLSLSLERVERNDGSVLWNKCPEDFVTNRHTLDLTISDVMDNIRNGQTNIMNIYEKILHHNLGTLDYNSLDRRLQHCLYTDSLQTERNDFVRNSNSSVTKFLQYNAIIQGKQSHHSDPRGFRSLIVHKAKRINDIAAINKSDYIVQPLMQGFRFIVYTSPTETKCHNRFGELFPAAAFMRNNKNCTFEAILLPIDAFNMPRSWRCWPFKKRSVMYIVDVYRFEHTILLDIPFVERLKYIDIIVENSKNSTTTGSIMLAKIPSSLQTFAQIEEKYISNRDVFDPIVGVIMRKPTDTIATPPIEYRFNIRYSFNLLNLNIVDLSDAKIISSDTCKRLHMNLEMADYTTLCLAYGHCEKFIYLCDYDRMLHQFVHFGRLVRMPHEFGGLIYKPEQIYVINNQIIPQGICFVRVYYDCKFNVLGYDNKLTDNRYMVPYNNALYSHLRKTGA